MADSAGTARHRIDHRDGRPHERRVSRLAIVLFVGAVILLGLVSPRGLTAVHVGFNAVAGLLWLVAAVVARRWPRRMFGIPVWLGFLALSACFLALAVLEARQRLG